MRILTKQDILSLDDRNRQLVEVPEWNGAVYIQCMSAAERDLEERRIYDAQQTSKGSEAMTNFRARFLARTLVDAEGTPLFSIDEVDVLANRSFPVIARLYDVAQRINGMTESEVQAIEGNS